MTLPTPREAAEALFNKLANFSASNAKDRINGKVAIIEAAFAARDRALLAEDEATIEAMAQAMGEEGATIPYDQIPEDAKIILRRYARATLAALRRLRGVE